MIPHNKECHGIIIELKWQNNLNKDKLDTLASEALKQISSMNYDAELKELGINNIIKFGIAFSKKQVSIKVEE